MTRLRNDGSSCCTAQDPAAAPLLSTMLTNATVPVARMGALWALATSGALTEGQQCAGCHNPHASRLPRLGCQASRAS